MSENTDNHAIRRGKWIRERLLGLTVPDLPISVDAQLPDAPHKTLRERMEVTKQAYCWQCHQKMNPPGLAFENFDHFGRHRKTETVKITTEVDVPAKGKKPPMKKVKETPKEVPLNSTGLIEKSGDPSIDGQYPDSIALMHKLAKSDRVRQVFVRHAFRYWMGREETPGDAASLQAIDKAFVQSGGSFKALVQAILTSDAFLYRTSTP